MSTFRTATVREPVLFACWIIALLSTGALAAPAANQSEVADAAMHGDKVHLRTLLDQKSDVNAPQMDGTTALHCAVEENDLELTDLLIRAGARVSAANQAGATPLLLATVNGNAAIVERLIMAGADPNAPLTKFGDTAIMMASRTGKG
jgi:ankyrin repeat protein